MKGSSARNCNFDPRRSSGPTINHTYVGWAMVTGPTTPTTYIIGHHQVLNQIKSKEKQYYILSQNPGTYILTLKSTLYLIKLQESTNL